MKMVKNGNREITCKECGKEIKRKDSYEDWGKDDTWCSKDCWVKKLTKDEKSQIWGWVFFWSWVIINPIIAITGTIWILHHYWPDLILALSWIAPISLVATIASMFLQEQIFNPEHRYQSSAGMFHWAISCGWSYGGIFVLSLFGYLVSIFTLGIQTWLKG